MSAPFIEFAGVKKAFGPKVIYEDLTLSVQRGETLTILGGSGVGKSVMLKMLIGLLTVDKGDIHFDGPLATTLANAPERAFGTPILLRSTLHARSTVSRNARSAFWSASR